MDASQYLRRKKEAMQQYIHRTPFLDAGLRTEMIGRNAAAVTPIANPHIVPTNCCATTTAGPDCSKCDPNYVWNPYDSERCFRTESVAAIAPVLPIALSSNQNPAYGSSGTRIYTTFNLDASPIATPTILTTAGLWQRTSGSDGPLNRSGLWNNTTPVNTWVGFSAFLPTLTETKTYYLGIGADNAFRFVLDGVTIVNSLPNTVYTNNGTSFLFWHVYPVVISAGQHVIEVYGLDIGPPGSFGCEIYNNTPSELAAATTISDLNIVFTTQGQTQATVVQDLNGAYQSSGYTCPPGYVYSACSGGQCVRYIYCNPSTETTTTVSPCCRNNDRSDLYTHPYIVKPCCPYPTTSTMYLSPCKVLEYQATPAQQSEASKRVTGCC